MIKYLKYSRRIHFLVILSFLTPFFYTGCNDTNAPKSENDKLKADSTISDSLKKNSEYTDSNMVHSGDAALSKLDLPVDTTLSKATSPGDSAKKYDTDNPSEKIAVRYPFFKPVLYPEKFTFSGLALVIDSFTYVAICASSVVFAFLLLLLSLSVKFIEKQSVKSIVLMELLAIVFLSIAPRFAFYVHDTLWGYWVAVSLLSFLTLFDIYSIVLNKRFQRDEPEIISEQHNIYK